MTPAEMKAHIIELCDRNHIRYRFRPTARRAFASGIGSKRKIVCPEIKSRITYLMALHELGHHLGGDQGKRRIVGEIGAWEWALENARCNITPGVKKTISRCLRSYVNRYTTGYGLGAKQAWLPSESDHPEIHARLTRLIEGRYRSRRAKPADWPGQ